MSAAGTTAEPRAARALHDLPLTELAARLRTGALSSQALTEHFLARIGELDHLTRSFVLVTAEVARERAAAADRDLAAGNDRGPLHGIPYALKDIFDTAGIPTTNHSRLTLDRVPEHDSGVEERLRAAGAVLLGKLATHEFALGGPSPDLPFPPARNPWNLRRVPGGSSSGAGAAVAAGLTPFAVGSDTSGSIRGPAAHSGVVGFKPTYGLVSRRGAFPLSYALDHCGPLVWRVGDVATVTEVLAGFDPGDPTSVDQPPPDLSTALTGGVRGLRVACPRAWFAKDPSLHHEMATAVNGALGALRAAGAEVVDVDLPPYRLFNACGRVIMAAEAFAVHEQALRERPEHFGRYTYQRIAPAAGLSAADLVQAFRVRRELTVALDAVLERHDVLVTASALAPAASFEAFGADWPPPPEASAMQAIPFNVTGHPALVTPVGLSTEGLPMGVQIAGRAFDEATVLRVAAVLEPLLGDRTRRPPGFGDPPGGPAPEASSTDN